jgi:large subunit ribosomal protein L1
VEVAKPDATYEIVVKTAMTRGTTIPKGRVNLPREAKPKREDKILVFATGQLAKDAKDAGADIVGGEELIEGVSPTPSVVCMCSHASLWQVISGKHQATTILCTSALIRTITPKLGRILGPKGLMPSERRGTVTDDIAGYIKKLSGSAEWRGDKAGAIRMPVGKVSRLQIIGFTIVLNRVLVVVLSC